VKKTAFSEYDKSRREGWIAINLRDGDEVVRVVATAGDDDLMMVTFRGMAIRFSEAEVREMGRDATGVRGIKLRADDKAISLDVVRDDADLFVVTDTGFGKRVKTSASIVRVEGTGRAGHQVDRRAWLRGGGLHGSVWMTTCCWPQTGSPHSH